MAALRRSTALRREQPARRSIPYATHVAEHIVKTHAGDYIQVFRLGGASFETADDAQLNNWHERLNGLWRNIGRENIALWMHLIRRPETLTTAELGGTGFAARLAERYQQRLSGETLRVNEWHLSVVYRPAIGMAANVLSRALARNSAHESSLELEDSLDTCEKLAQTLASSLSRYEPQRLGIYDWRGRRCSRLLEVLGVLINGEWQRMTVPQASLNRVLAVTRPFFGFETIEYRMPTQTRLGAMLGIIEYSTPTLVGMLDALLSASFPFVLTQSFAFLKKSTAQGLLQRQYNRMQNAGDFATSQADELKGALDELTSNEWAMGDHHFTLQVLSDSVPAGDALARAGLNKQLNDRIAAARSLLADHTGMTVGREDLALEAAYWAQLPGNFAFRPRKAPITTRNLCALTGFHNHPVGRATGNHWGDALTLFATRARSPYYFSLHASDPNDADGGSAKDTGHTFICGPTGAGKSVFIGFLVAMLAQQGATQVIFDKDRGQEILVRALGGTYLSLRNGASTGFNPLQLPAVPQHFEFLKTWLRLLVQPANGAGLTVREQADLDQALRGTLALEAPARRLSRLVEFTDATDPEGLYARLSPWCESTGGDYAWVFDNAEDRVQPHFASGGVLGFDVTEFLSNATIRTPVTFYLFHLVRQLLDGRALVCWMEEFWRLLADPVFTGFAKDGPKTWRKLNGVMCFATQSPSDVLESDISRTIIEQTPTKVFFPNTDASTEDYTSGFGLTAREFKLVKERLEPGSRMFLVKQGHHSVVCQLDLKGFDAELAILSSRLSTVEKLHRIMAEVGSNPEQWLPLFQAEFAATQKE
jgi:type IV secretion system protein VirB4